jgi:hypothetical protein
MGRVLVRSPHDDRKIPNEDKTLKTFGEPGRTRTYNPLIKSQLLYH